MSKPKPEPKPPIPKFYDPLPEHLPGCKPEQALCYDFIIEAIEAGWRVYPEYPDSEFDMLLVAEKGCSTQGVEVGTQIGIQAKMKLNPKLMEQMVNSVKRPDWRGPDYVVALVPGAPRTPAEKGLESILLALGHGLFYVYSYFESHDQERNKRRRNLETMAFFGKKRHDRRIELPEINVWVEPGIPSPVSFSGWRIKDVKRILELEKLGTFTRSEFDALKPKMSLRFWRHEGWVEFTGEKRGREFIYRLGDVPERPDRADQLGRDIRAELERLNDEARSREEGQAEAGEQGEGAVRES